MRRAIHIAFCLTLLLVFLVPACSPRSEPVPPPASDSNPAPIPFPVSNNEETNRDVTGEMLPDIEDISIIPDKPIAKLSGLYWMVSPKSGLEGSEERFQKLLDTLEETLTGNLYISGVYVIQHWDLIKPEEGTFQFDRLD
ncbi:hypothetical protein ACFLVZ_01870 [Chloroflexota bacterium]